jgi:hypothetical protein
LLAAEPGSELSLPVLMGGVFVAAVAGDSVGYASGRRYGRPWVLRRAGKAAAHVERAEVFYERYGWFALVAARFIPWVRTLTPIVAGVAGCRTGGSSRPTSPVRGVGRRAGGTGIRRPLGARRALGGVHRGCVSVLASVVAAVGGRCAAAGRLSGRAGPVRAAGGSGAEPTGSASPK